MRLVKEKLVNPEVRIENTNRCNARCIICPREKMTRPQVTMSQEHFENLVDQSVELGAKTISIFGYGEPLLDKGIASKVRVCTDKGLETFLTTNAALLTDGTTKELIKAGLRHIRFSAHGFNDSYEYVHWGLKWRRVSSNIANFISINDKEYGHSVTVSLSVIPMFAEPLSRIRSYWEKQVDYLEVWRPHNWVDGRSYRGLTVMRLKKTCGRPASGPIQIQADGKMIVCCFDYNGKLEIGDTNFKNIKEILEDKELKYIRKSHETGQIENLICNTCDQLNIEAESPLIYSNRDKTRAVGKTSSTKFNLGE